MKNHTSLPISCAHFQRSNGRLAERSRDGETPPEIAVLSSAPLDVLVHRIDRGAGAKHAASTSVCIGGCGPNVARAAARFDVRTALVTSQAAALMLVVQAEMSALGGTAYFVERPETLPAITVGMANGSPGSYELYVQSRPLFQRDVAEFMSVFESARIGIVGPMPAPDENTRAMMKEVAEASEFAALIPHADLLRSVDFFAEVAAAFSYVQMNAAEARALFGGTGEDILELAVKLRGVLGSGIEFAITNGALTGILGARDGKFHAISPPTVQTISDVGAGDAFSAGYLILRVIRGESPAEACAAATALGAAVISGR